MHAQIAHGILRKGYEMSKAETTAYELNDYAMTNWDAKKTLISTCSMI